MKMDEYIRKDKAIDIFIEGDGDNEFTEGYNFAVNEYREKIKAMPAADVQPIKHGRWIEHNDWIECNECKFEVNDRYYEKCDMTSTETRYAYCPHCGAKMIKDGEQK